MKNKHVSLLLIIFAFVFIFSRQIFASEEKQITAPQAVETGSNDDPEQNNFRKQQFNDKNAKTTETTLSLTLHSAILMALENNASFQLDRLSPKISAASEEMQEAVFDPEISVSLSGQRENITPDGSDQQSSTSPDSDSATAEVQVKEYLPTGTTIEVDVQGDILNKENSTTSKNKTGDIGITVTQSLLKNRGLDANLALLRSARLETKISIHELQGVAEALITQVEESYWNYILAERSMDIYEKSLNIANNQVIEVKERIRVGKIPGTELASAQAEAASRLEQLIDAQCTLSIQRINLIRLLSSHKKVINWDSRLDLLDTPETDIDQLATIEEHVNTALKKRADIRQARLKAEQGDLELVSTRNGLLPKLDIFVSLGGSRYANSFSYKSDEDGKGVSYGMGIQFEFPFGTRNAKAKHRQQLLSKKQTMFALTNMEQLIQVDVRSAIIDVNRTFEGIKATKATLILREKILGIEMEKFRIGKSTTFLVAQARRDMITSQIGEIEAIIDYRKAFANLYRLEGTQLERLKIKL